MIPILFEEDAMDFSTNGIGVLVDTIRCVVGEEHNGALDAEMDYSADGPYANDIREGRLFLAKPNDVDEPHVFRIYEVERMLDEGIIFAKALSITNDLAGNLILHAEVEDATPQEALNKIKQNLIEPTTFDLISDIETRSSSSWTRINPLQAIAGIEGSLVHYWGGDVKRTNDTVYLYSRRGRDKAVTIRPGKNIEGFSMTVSTKGVVTKILPFITYTPEEIPEYEIIETYDGGFEKRRKVSADDNRIPPKTIIGNVVASDNVDRYPVVHYSTVDYSSNEDMVDAIHDFIDDRRLEAEESEEIMDNSGFLDELDTFVTNLLNNKAQGYFIYEYPGIDEPNVSIDVDMLQLSDSPEWERFKGLEHIQVTDTVIVYVPKFDLDTEVSIESVTYDAIGEKIISITAGSKVNTLFQTMTKDYEDRTKRLEDYIDTLENGVYNSISRTANGLSRKFSGYTEPSHDISRNGDMWFRMVGSGVVEMYIYDGGSWQPVLSGDVVDQINQELDDAKQMAEDASTKAQGTIDDINDAIGDSGFTSLSDLLASKIGDDDFSTLYFQQSKAIGLVYEVGGVTESIIMLDEGIPYIRGKNIILDGNTIVKGDFTVTDEMLASDAVINRLIATGIDADEVNIINLNANNISGGNLDLSKGLQITNNGVPVLSVDANTGQIKITAPNLATKEDLVIDGQNLAYGTETPESANGRYPAVRYKVNFDALKRLEGKEITMSFEARSDTPYQGSAYICDMSNYTTKGYHVNRISVGMIESDWSRYELVGTVLENIVLDDISEFTLVSSAIRNTLEVRNLKIEKGNKATDWTLAPEEEGAAILASQDRLQNLEDMEIGGRNYITKEKIYNMTGPSSLDTDHPDCPNGFWSRGSLSSKIIIQMDDAIDSNGYWTVSFDIKHTSLHNQMNAGWHRVSIAGSNYVLMPEDWPDRDVWERVHATFYIDSYDGENGYLQFRPTYANIFVRNLKLEKGHKPTDWTPALEDSQVDFSELDSLAEMISDISSEVNLRAGMGELQAMQEAFNARAAQDIADKDKLIEDLNTLEGRTALVETLAGNNKIVTQFIDTVITESDEGMFIGNVSNDKGILISEERISFVDGKGEDLKPIEVAYISNRTLKITHGIFVESATIGGFKFERIPGTEILSLKWAGDD